MRTATESCYPRAAGELQTTIVPSNRKLDVLEQGQHVVRFREVELSDMALAEPPDNGASRY